jgi:hypothetical protein
MCLVGEVDAQKVSLTPGRSQQAGRRHDKQHCESGTGKVAACDGWLRHSRLEVEDAAGETVW